MDLSALWSHERARLTGTHAEPPPASASHAASAFDGPIIEEKRDRQGRGLTRVNSSLQPRASQQQQTPKRRSTVFAKRDAVFKRLVDESVLPAVAAVAAVQNFFDCNEFAMEYADRAPKRFYAAPTSAAVSTATGGGGPSGTLTGSSLNGGAALSASSSPQRRDKKGTPRSIGRLQPATPSGSSNSSSSGAPGALGTTHTPSSNNSSGANSSSELAATTAIAPKPSFLSRKNGRKKLEFSSARDAFRPYVGDMFGTRGEYIDGMLYMSRMKRSHQLTFGEVPTKGSHKLFGGSDALQLVSALKDAVSSALASAVTGGSSSSSTGADGASAPDGVAGSTGVSGPGSVAASYSGGHRADLGGGDHPAKQRRRCALTLSNWSSNPENAVLMVREGVVEALIVLCRANDGVTRLHCVTALMNLSHVVELRRVIVRQGAVKTIAEIVDESEDKTLRTACAITLCNLCCLEGDEEVLVEDGAVSALSVLITEQPRVAWLCRSALFNLTCVREPYQKIESVLKMFITLASSSGSGGAASSSSPSSFSAADCDEVTAKALCNLSNFKRIRLRLMEEGVIGAISSLIHVNAPDIQEMLAYVLLNLSALKACRSEMVGKGCMGTLVALTGATSASAAKLLIASTLFNLSKEPGNRLRMVFEGLLLLVNELSRGSMGYAGGEALRTVCARTLYNISCSEDTRVKLVERDGVSILSSLSRRTSDRDAKRMCTLALCNLLGVQQAAADIMNAGAITALIQLSMTPDQPLETKRLFSKALHGLCEQHETRDAVTRAGVIPAILYLSSIGNDGQTESGLVSEVRARCTAALACLAADDALAIHVCNVQVVRCVTRILVLERSHVAIERFCCSCLSLLCRDEECSQLMVDEGSVQVVLSTCVETLDLETKASCCNVLASMSCHPSCCTALVRMGVVSVLATLAKIKEDRGIQRCCAITLANLSAEPSIRGVLVTAGVISIVALLSNSYSEESQRDCAKVLCNLSCVPGNEAHLVSDGAVGVLMMIGMVRAVNANTKETCARALFNLLNAETIKTMVQEGLVKILSALAVLEAPSSSASSGASGEVVAMLFMKLVEHPIGRSALCVERSALKALFALMERSGSVQVQRLFESLLCELVYYENSRLPSVNAGIVDALHKTTMRGGASGGSVVAAPSCSAKRLAFVLFTLAKCDETRMAVASSASIATLTVFLQHHAPMPACQNAECVDYAAATFCTLAWYDDTRGRLEHPEISNILMKLLTPDESGSASSASTEEQLQAGVVHYPPSVIKTTLLTLCCISQNQELLQAMLRDRVIDALHAIFCRDSPQFCEENADLARDRDFVALACALCRQLSHTPQLSVMAGMPGSHVIPLLCILTTLVAESDPDSSLDCADALCSITFAAVKMPPPSLLVGTASGGSDPVAALVSPTVVAAINSLLSDSQLPETRWRCTASLSAMSFLPAYRARLVALGCTRILVNESSRSASSASLSILKCCAGALCNFTLVMGDNSVVNANAAKMVAEDAVPALLRLSTLENAEVREHCTLALTNLSGQSPKVEAGAVSALLSLSLHATTAAASHLLGAHLGLSHHRPRSAATPQVSALCQPPIVCGERHKQFSKLPEFAMEIERDERVSERKYEADLDASTPPPPQLPTIPAELDASGGGSSKHPGAGSNAHEDDEMQPQRAGSADRPLSQEGNCHDPRQPLVAKSFPKVDPSESRLLGGGAEADDASDDNSDPQRNTANGSSLRSEAVNDSEETRDNGNRGGDSGGVNSAGSSGDQDDAGEQDETVGQLRKGVALLKGGSGYSLSPLARVVVRKSQTTQVAKKLKDLRARRGESGESRDGFVSSSPSLASTSHGGLSQVARGSSRSLFQAAMGKSGRGTDLMQPNKLLEDPFSAPQCRNESQANDTAPLSRLDGSSSIAAAAAAARLYGAPAPAAVDSGSKGLRVTSKKRTDKSSAKKTTAKAIRQQQHIGAGAVKAKTEASRSTIAKYLPVSPSSDDDEDDNDDNNDNDYFETSTDPSNASVAIADFREQAKRFGLWS